jgi:outer membrane lipase/esterase
MNVRSWGLSALAAFVLAACGGGGDGDQNPRVSYSALVSFGDSLSDVGTYATPVLASVTGGGKYTVNGPDARNWTELLAAQLRVAAPCPAQTGLNASGPLAAFAAAVADHDTCTNYAQGGARVTNPVGPGNAALLGLGDNSGLVGQLTDPVLNQINRHFAEHGAFTGNELVTVLAGGNDVFMNLATFGATVGTLGPTVAGGNAVTAMGTAGAELAGYINNLIVGRGARHVVVLTLPDVSETPLGYRQDPQVRGLIQQMVIAFNTQLVNGLTGTQGVLVVDLYTQNRLQVASPVQYGVTNVTTPACDLDLLAQTVFESSLVCSTNTLIAGDTSHYAFADEVHPTPYGYRLIAQFVTDRLLKAGWL